ncbi:hypothetical protein VCHA53O466_40454 [Vibrio chagasii]|nr:hypothetical protein VCHA53O466_40454 [Vibrio chagasii]
MGFVSKGGLYCFGGVVFRDEIINYLIKMSMIQKLIRKFVGKGDESIQSLALPFEGSGVPVGCKESSEINNILDHAVEGGWNEVYIESKGGYGLISVMQPRGEKRLLSSTSSSTADNYIQFISGVNVSNTGTNGVTTNVSHVIYDYTVNRSGEGVEMCLRLLCSEPRYVFDKAVDNPLYFGCEAYEDLGVDKLAAEDKAVHLARLESSFQAVGMKYSLALRSTDAYLDGVRWGNADSIEPKKQFMQLLSGYLRDWIYRIGAEKHIEHNVLMQTEDSVYLLNVDHRVFNEIGSLGLREEMTVSVDFIAPRVNS